MKTNRRCPDCKQWLELNTDECYCGWIADAPKNVSIDHRCVYQHLANRCPYPGTISSGVHASSPMYCLGHYLNLNNAENSLAILREAEKNFIAVIEDRIHWTVKLIPKEYKKAKKAIQDLYLKQFKK